MLCLAAAGCGQDRDGDRGSSTQTGAATRATATDLSPATSTNGPAAPAAARSLERLVGQKLVVSYRGATQPPASLLARIEAGRVGGVILFTDNVPADGAAGVRRVVRRLRAAARRGGNPPLLVATDQEGGDVRRMPGPPDRSPRQLGRQPADAVRAAGGATGAALRRMGIGVDLAPVADLARAGSFLGTRTFSADAARNTAASVAFARGLQSAGVAATAKHYPGLGTSGQTNTDLAAVSLATPRDAMARERAGFLRHVAAGTRLIMVSNAAYDAYDPGRPAVVSRKILGRLRSDGFGGVIISDELAVPGLRRFGSRAAGLASTAGVDLLLYANTDGAQAYDALLADVRAGRVKRSTIERQVQRIIALKRWIARAVP